MSPAKDARIWAVLTHLAGLLFPPLSVVAGVILWQVKCQDGGFADASAREAVNFQISMMIYLTIAGLAVAALIGWVLLPLLAVFNVVCVIIATVKTSNRESYLYPLCLRLIK